MENKFTDVPEAKVYIDNIGVFSDSLATTYDSTINSATETARQWFHCQPTQV